MENLQRFTTIGDTDGVGAIWTCCTICLAHLAALSHLMSQTDPASRASTNGLCDLALGNLGNLSLEVHIEAYSDFDVLTGVCILRWFFSTHEASEALTKLSYTIRCLGKGR